MVLGLEDGLHPIAPQLLSVFFRNNAADHQGQLPGVDLVQLLVDILHQLQVTSGEYGKAYQVNAFFLGGPRDLGRGQAYALVNNLEAGVTDLIGTVEFPPR